MFGWLKKNLGQLPTAEATAYQRSGEIFTWPQGAVLTAMDEVVLALPTALLPDDRPMSESIYGPDDMGFAAPSDSDVCFIRLQPGMSVSLAKSVQAYVVADDDQPRRFKIALA